MDLWRGKWALVTGASAGIGWALAEELATGGANLVLTARRRERLEELAAKLRAANGANVEIVTADLALATGPEEIFSFTEQKRIAVDLLVNNAGFGAYGEFYGTKLAGQLGMVQVNCSAVVHLTHLYLPQMVERRRGHILIVASTAAFQPVPYISAYAATKAFDLLFAEGLAEEVARYGVHVCALCPGPTATEFGEVAGTPKSKDGEKLGEQDAREVARVGLAGLATGKTCVISGFKNRISAQAHRFLPRSTAARVAERVLRPKYLK
ncbi:MAG TPA: SDR family oxidoreductase [Terriglobia bacterium]|nr:SDR family oxidoreductase [Terriglobia bacterium]